MYCLLFTYMMIDVGIIEALDVFVISLGGFFVKTRWVNKKMTVN